MIGLFISIFMFLTLIQFLRFVLPALVRDLIRMWNEGSLFENIEDVEVISIPETSLDELEEEMFEQYNTWNAYGGKK